MDLVRPVWLIKWQILLVAKLSPWKIITSQCVEKIQNMMISAPWTGLCFQRCDTQCCQLLLFGVFIFF